VFKMNIKSAVFAVLVLIMTSARADQPSLDCVFEPHEVVEISSPVKGILEMVNVERGDIVKKGQIIAKLKSGIEEANVKLMKASADMDVDINARKAEYDLKKRFYERLDVMYKKKTISFNEYDDAKTLRDIAEFEYQKAIEMQRLSYLELAHAEAVLRQRYLKATVNGVVVERMKSPGEYVEAQPVIKLAQVDPLNVEVIAPISFLGKVFVGMEVEVKAEYPVNTTFIAKVVVVDSVIHASSGTFGIRLNLPNADHEISAGLRCKVNFIENNKASPIS
jgi:RND family efflux transporter MFP subunit